MQASALKALDESLQRDNLSTFYDNEELEPLQMISYMDQLRIFGKVIDYNHLMESNRELLRSHFVLYNTAFDSLWKYKYYVLVLRCLYLGGSIVFTSEGQNSFNPPSLVIC